MAVVVAVWKLGRAIMPTSTTRGADDQNRCGPTHDGGADRRHSRPPLAAAGFEEVEAAAEKTTAGPSVRPAATTTSMPIVIGAPMVLNQGSRVENSRQ